MAQLIGYLSEGEQLKGSLTIPQQLGGSTLGSKTITANGVYDATDDGLDGYDVVTANVPNTYAAGDEGKVVDNGALVSQTTATYTVNNTYDTTKIKSVTVNVGGGSPTLETITKTYTPSTSQQTEQITPSSGYDGIAEVDVTVDAMPTGTEGTPTATKGSVSNHSVSVTPSVTNTTGYITGSTKTGTAVTVSASELVSGAKTISANGTGIDVANFATADVAVQNSYTSSDEGKVVSNGALVSQTAHADVTPTTSDQTIDTTLNNSLKVKGDADLVAGNIKKDVEIFGVTGSYEGGGGTEEAPFNDVCFWDYDGKCLYSYSASEFANLSALPSNPSHSGLTSQGWNWSLADAKAHVAANGFLDIGQIYVTDDGKTRYILHIKNPATTLKIALTGSVTGNLTINWGDGSATETNTGTSAKTYEHVYATVGDYTLTIAVSSGTVSLGVITGTDDRTIFRGCHIGSNAKLRAQAFNTCMWLSYLTIPSDCDISAFSYASMGVKCLILPAAFAATENVSSDGLNEIICFAKQTNIYGAYGQFAQSRALKRVSIPLGRNNAAWQVQSFIGCRSLKRFLIHDGCTGFGNANSTQDLYCLEKVTIPASITQIQGGSFSNVYSLQEVHMLATTPPTLGGTGTWTNHPSTFKIFVPYSADHSVLATYKSASNWSSFASYIVEEPQ